MGTKLNAFSRTDGISQEIDALLRTANKASRSSPILYALRDLTQATKKNFWRIVWNGSMPVDAFLVSAIESAAAANIQLEHALWIVLQEPWLGMDMHSWRKVHEFRQEIFVNQNRGRLRQALANKESFATLSCPKLLSEATEAGFHIRQIMPLPGQIQRFSPSEHAHHKACVFPLAPNH